MMIPFNIFQFLSIFALFLDPFSHATPVSISLSRKSIPKSGDPITIKWSGIDAPSELDWLGIYSPGNSSNRYFIGYLFLSSSPDWKSGSGSITIPLINLRSDYKFRIFHWTESEINPRKQDHDHNPLPRTKHLLAESETVTFESGRGPEQVHLALTGRAGEMRAMFVTGDGKSNFVKYGLARDKMDKIVRTQTSRYGREDMCGAPANQTVGWRDPGFMHDGVMTNLEEGKRYYYQVGSGARGWGKVHTFVSPIEESNETIAFLFGDMGTAVPYVTYLRTQVESISTIKWISRDIEAIGDKPALISHIGDISYARGYSWLWDNFFNQIEPLASKVPYHVCIGNHEYDWPDQPWRPSWAYSVYGTDGGGECGVPYSLRFHMPGNSSEPTGMQAPATRNLYYSFDMGVVHFVYFSTETNFLSGSKQYEFLKTDLESVNRSRTPFVVVQGHRPMYTTSHETRDIPFNMRLQAHLEPLFVNNNVTLVLWGHVHRYERFCPLNNHTCGSLGNGNDNDDPNWKRYPVHLVIGMGGQDWQPIWEPRPNHPTDPVFPQPVWSMYRGGEFGYVRLEANREKLTVSYIGNHDGEVHDSVEMMASGQVLNGRGTATTNDNEVGVIEKVDTRLSWYVKVASIVVVGGFVGYVLGSVSRWRRVANWTPVKTEDI